MADLIERIESAIADIRPMLQADGGDIEFVELDGAVVKVRLKGACSGCPMAKMTLKNGVEARLKKEIEEIDSVEEI